MELNIFITILKLVLIIFEHHRIVVKHRKIAIAFDLMLIKNLR